MSVFHDGLVAWWSVSVLASLPLGACLCAWFVFVFWEELLCMYERLCGVCVCERDLRTHMSTYTYLYIYMHTYMHTNTFIQTYIYTFAWMHVYK